MASAQTPIRARLAPDPFAAHIAEAAQRFGIPEAWIRAVMRIESRGRADATSPKGAMGLMQIMPSTWTYLSGRHALGRDPYEPRANILAGAAYLRAMYDRYGSVDAMLAAYNAGPGRYEASRAGRALPAETIGYVAALGPAIDGQAAGGPVRLAAADPFAWTRASLFAAQPERRVAANSEVAGSRDDGSSGGSNVRDLSAIVPQSGGLFVARSGDGEAR
ncbi:lytic transglycosylase domain-containing protein [Sphingomonas adhaesiva]|uniref:lytic transglycosylase domain-containing protein n=1 Tax=Sphingomonas adhaesiva TaxID=28212 RepID=UPI002FFABA24